MGEENIYNDLFGIVVFIGALWGAGYFCRVIKISPIVGQILIGIILGPNVLDFVPLFNGRELLDFIEGDGPVSNTTRLLGSVLSAIAPAYGLQGLLTVDGETIEEPENIWVILGQLGVALIIMESGIHVDFVTLRAVGGSAFLVAVIGTVANIGIGMLMAGALGFDIFPEGLPMGAVLAPTSAGVAVTMLHQAHVLESRFGQTIVTAAFIDDIFSLLTLTVLLQIASGSLSIWGILQPIVFSCLFLFVTFVIAIYIVPRVLPKFLERVAHKYSQDTRDMVHLFMMFVVLGIYGFIGNKIGSHLLGAFVSGLTFVSVPRTAQIWSREIEPLNKWLVALFFGATVGFAVPVQELLSLDIFWRGLIFGCLPGIFGKVISGIALKKRWVVGWAMVGRGEFSFLVGKIMKVTNFQDTGKPFLSSRGFAIDVWALLVCTMVAPIAFGLVLKSQAKEEAVMVQDDNNKISRLVSKRASVLDLMAPKENDIPKSPWLVEVEAKNQKGLLKDIMSIFYSMGVQVKSYMTEGEEGHEIQSFMVMIQDSGQAPTIKPGPSEASVKRHLSYQEVAAGAAKERPRAGSVTFSDNFFEFNVEIFVDKLRERILAAANGNAIVRLNPLNSSNRPMVAPGPIVAPAPSKPKVEEAPAKAGNTQLDDNELEETL